MIFLKIQEIPWGSSGWDSILPLQGAQVWMDPPGMPQDVAKKKRKRHKALKKIRKKYKTTKEIFTSWRWFLLVCLFGAFPFNLFEHLWNVFVAMTQEGFLTPRNISTCHAFLPLYSPLSSCLTQLNWRFFLLISENPNVNSLQGQAQTSCLILPSRNWLLFSYFCVTVFMTLTAITTFHLVLWFRWTLNLPTR